MKESASSEDGRARRWLLSTVLLTLCVSCSSGATPWLHAVVGAFHPPDFAQDVAAGQAIAAGLDPYQVDFAAWHARIMGVPPEQGYPYLPHPPFALLLTLPFAYQSFTSAASAWFAISLALLAVLAVVLAEIASGTDVGAKDSRPATSTVLVFFGLLLAWPPVLYNLEKGQLSILLAVLIAFSWRSLARGESRSAGLFLGIAAAVKIFPAIIGGYLLFRNRISLIWLTAIAAAATLLPLFWLGLHAIPGFLRHSQGNLAYWATWPAVTYSLYGLAARVLMGGTWAVPFVHAPELVWPSVAIVSVALLGVAVSAVRTIHQAGGRDAACFAAWTILLVSLNPLSMGHNGVLLALPIVLVTRALEGDSRTWLRMLWSLGVMLASIPRQTIFRLIIIPVEPMIGLTVVALPLLGTLLLFAASATLSRTPERSRVERDLLARH